MTQHLSERDVRGIAEYTRIGLTDDEVGADDRRPERHHRQRCSPSREYDLAGVEPTFHPIGGLSNVMREDVEEPVASRRKSALENAPKQQDG